LLERADCVWYNTSRLSYRNVHVGQRKSRSGHFGAFQYAILDREAYALDLLPVTMVLSRIMRKKV